MITINFIAPEGHLTLTSGSFDAKPGQNLMRAAVSAGLEGIAADCGGALSCATCHVIVDPSWAAHLPAPSVDEGSMLDMTAAPREPHSRLSCQIALDESLDGLTVRLPVSQY